MRKSKKKSVHVEIAEKRSRFWCRNCNHRHICRLLKLAYELDGAVSAINCDVVDKSPIWDKQPNIIADILRDLLPKVCTKFEYEIKD